MKTFVASYYLLNKKEIEENKKFLVEWNNLITKDDTIFFLGTPSYKILEKMKDFNGNKILIKEKGFHPISKIFFSSIFKEDLYIMIDNKTILLSCNRIDSSLLNIYGNYDILGNDEMHRYVNSYLPIPLTELI